MLYIQ